MIMAGRVFNACKNHSSPKDWSQNFNWSWIFWTPQKTIRIQHDPKKQIHKFTNENRKNCSSPHLTTTGCLFNEHFPSPKNSDGWMTFSPWENFPTPTSPQGWSALHYAVQSGSLEMVRGSKKILKVGGFVYRKREWGKGVDPFGPTTCGKGMNWSEKQRMGYCTWKSSSGEKIASMLAKISFW